jgi:hypothetical protein
VTANSDIRERLSAIKQELEEIEASRKEWEQGKHSPNWWSGTGLPRIKALNKELHTLAQSLPKENDTGDPLQEAVITASVSERLLVDAGPGTGKTEVACRRVAWLIDEAGIYPDNIRLISFTRAAVHEIRDRIGTYLENRDQKFTVKIATIDSYASEIIRGYNEKFRITGTYDDSIAESLRLITTDDATSEIFEKTEHLIIDESQDIVGIRAEFLLAFIRELPKTGGVTVFSDNAQAIYDWLAQQNPELYEGNRNPLSLRIPQEFPGKFREVSLKTVHRTKSKNLIHLFTKTRDLVLLDSVDSKEKFHRVRDEIRAKADNSVRKIESQNITGCNNCFILYRENREVLFASEQLATTPHRIRMKDLPWCIHPWLGICLSEFTGPIMKKQEFLDIWEQKAGILNNNTPGPDAAWAQLETIAGQNDGTISLRILRGKLWHQHPPDIICTREIGPEGPIISTIHASKGREADDVRLMLPSGHREEGQSNEQNAEETRVLFVGATRARRRLSVGEGYSFYPISNIGPYNRRYNLIPKRQSAKIQIGCENDITARDVAKNMSETDIRTSQNILAGLSGKITGTRMVKQSDSDFRYLLKADGGKIVADITDGSLKTDMTEIKNRLGRKMNTWMLDFPDTINDLRIFGVRTIVLKPDSQESSLLRYPWNTSGIVLAPVIMGFPEIIFKAGINSGVIKL